MQRQPLKPLRPGDRRISAGNMNLAFEQIETAARMQPGPGIGFADGGSSLTFFPLDGPPPKLIRITAGTNPYEWEGVLRSAVAGEAEDYETTGEVGTAAAGLLAVERNNNAAVPAGSVVVATHNTYTHCLEFEYQAAPGPVTRHDTLSADQRIEFHGEDVIFLEATVAELSVDGINTIDSDTPVDGHRLRIENVGSYPIYFAHDVVGSPGVEGDIRFFRAGGPQAFGTLAGHHGYTVMLWPGSHFECVYDGDAAKWKCHEPNLPAWQITYGGIGGQLVVHDDWDFGGLGGYPADIFLVHGDHITITGIANGVPSWRLRIHNYGSYPVTLAHNDAGSAAGNRIYCVGGADILIPQHGYADLIFWGPADAPWYAHGAEGGPIHIANLTDPSGDRIAFWDDSASAMEWLTIGSGLSITGTTLSVTVSYTNEDAQDAVGGILTDTATIDFTYNDGAGTITADVKADAISNTLLADMPAWSLKVRNAGTSGDPSDAAAANWTEETGPAAGDFLIGFLDSGELRKFNVSRFMPSSMDAWTFKIRNAGTSGDASNAALANFTTEASPAAGDFLIGFLDSGEIRKFDVGDFAQWPASPVEDRILFFDESANQVTWLDLGNGLSIVTDTLNLLTLNSIVNGTSGLELDGDESAPGNSHYYGTDASGSKGWHELASSGPATWVKITKTYTDLAAAATQNSITIYTLPARSIVLAAAMNHTTAFAGGGLATYTLDLGIAGTPAKYGGPYSVTGTPPSSGAPGSSATTNYFEDFFATVDVKLRATCDVNTNSATAGAVDIYLLIASAT